MTLNGADLNWATAGRNPGDYAVTVKVSDAAGSFDQKTVHHHLAAIGAGASREGRQLHGEGRPVTHGAASRRACERRVRGRRRPRCHAPHDPESDRSPRSMPTAASPTRRRHAAGRPAGDKQALERQRHLDLRRPRSGRGSQRRRLSRHHQSQPQHRHPGAVGSERRRALGAGSHRCARLHGDDRRRDESPRAGRHRRQRPSIRTCSRRNALAKEVAGTTSIIAYDHLGKVKWVSPPLSKQHPDIRRGATPVPPGGFTPGGLAWRRGLTAARLTANGAPVLLMRAEITNNDGYTYYVDAANQFHYAGCRAVTGLAPTRTVPAGPRSSSAVPTAASCRRWSHRIRLVPGIYGGARRTQGAAADCGRHRR